MDISADKLTFEVQTCAACGCVFALEQHHVESLRKSGKGFVCPNGHDLTFGKSEADKLREQLKSKEEEIGKRREIARLISKGHCPVCGKNFKNIVGHMQKKHPNYS